MKRIFANTIRFIKHKSSVRFLIFFSFLISLRLLELAVDYIEGNKDGIISSPIGLFLNLSYLFFTIAVAYNYSTVALKFNQIYVALIIIFLITLISFSTINPTHPWGDDWALYIEQSRALNEDSIEELRKKQEFLVKNSAYIVGPELYPWGYPYILAQAHKIFGFDIKIFKFFTFIFFPLSLLVIYFSFKNELRENAILILSAFAFSPLFFEYRNMIYSDIPAMFFQLLGLTLILKFFVKKHYFINQYVSYVILGVVLFSSYTIRTVGIILLPTLFFCQLYSFVVEHQSHFEDFIKENKVSFITYVVFFVSSVMYSTSFHYTDTSYLSHLTSNFYNI